MADYHYKSALDSVTIGSMSWNEAASFVGQGELVAASSVTFTEMLAYCARISGKKRNEITWAECLAALLMDQEWSDDGSELWPDTLPEWPLMADYGESLTGGGINVAAEKKSIIVRPGSTARVQRMSLAFNLTRDQVVAFENFFEYTLASGTKPFRVKHPRALYDITVCFDPGAETSYTITNQQSMNYFKVAMTVLVWR